MKQKATVTWAPVVAVARYPYIGVHKKDPELVVYFCDTTTGTCLTSSNTGNRPGSFSETWNEVAFEPLHGSITLEQL